MEIWWKKKDMKGEIKHTLVLVWIGNKYIELIAYGDQFLCSLFTDYNLTRDTFSKLNETWKLVQKLSFKTLE